MYAGGAGSGVIVSPDGHVLTAGHVSRSPGRDVILVLPGGRRVRGKTLGANLGTTVTALLAEATGQTPDETGHYRIRPPLKPVTLGELAAMDADAAQ